MLKFQWGISFLMDGKTVEYIFLKPLRGFILPFRSFSFFSLSLLLCTAQKFWQNAYKGKLAVCQAQVMHFSSHRVLIGCSKQI